MSKYKLVAIWSRDPQPLSQTRSKRNVSQLRLFSHSIEFGKMAAHYPPLQHFELFKMVHEYHAHIVSHPAAIQLTGLKRWKNNGLDKNNP